MTNVHGSLRSEMMIEARRLVKTMAADQKDRWAAQGYGQYLYHQELQKKQGAQQRADARLGKGLAAKAASMGMSVEELLDSLG